MTAFTFDLGQVRSTMAILGYFSTLSQLRSAISNPQAGDIYGVGSAAPYQLYAWDSRTETWVDNGTLKGERGETGPQGEIGPAGAAGAAATIQVGNVYTGDADSQARVENRGTASSAILDFYLPRGADGVSGSTGADGAPGQDGRSIELQNDGANICWRYEDEESWNDLVALEALRGRDGQGLVVLGQYDSAEALSSAVSEPEAGDCYAVGESAPYHIYIWDGVNETWLDNGTLQGEASGSGLEELSANTSTSFSGLLKGSGGKVAQATAGVDYAAIDHTHTGYAADNHSHSDYAAADHDHDDDYAAIDHTHTGYALSNHSHSDYAAASHDHDGDYAAIDHTHSGYAADNHSHSDYAAASHDHDEDYAAIDHTHTGYALSNHSHTEYLASSQKGAASGLATLDSDSKLTAGQASAKIVSVTTSKTLALTDAGCLLQVNSSSARTVTIPANTSVAFPIGTEIEIMRYGSGAVTIAANSGVTIYCSSSVRTIKDQYTSAALKKIATNIWVLQGNIG